MPQQFLINGASTTAPATTDYFHFIAAGANSNHIWTDDEVDRATPVAKAITLKSMVVNVETTALAGKSFIFTVMKNGVATSLAVTIANPDTQATITGESVSFAQGDTISIRYTFSDTTTDPGDVSWSILAESVTTDYFLVFAGTADAASAGDDQYQNLQGGTDAWNADLEDVDQPMPLTGTMTDMYFNRLGNAGSAGWDYTVMISTSTTALTVHYDAAENGVQSITGQSVAISAGN